MRVGGQGGHLPVRVRTCLRLEGFPIALGSITEVILGKCGVDGAYGACAWRGSLLVNLLLLCKVLPVLTLGVRQALPQMQDGLREVGLVLRLDGRVDVCEHAVPRGCEVTARSWRARRWARSTRNMSARGRGRERRCDRIGGQDSVGKHQALR